MTVEERIKGRRIGILGMARSGMAVARLTRELGGRPFVSDHAPSEKISELCRDLTALDVPFETGGHSEEVLKCDYLVISPGVPPNADILVRARDKGIPVFPELELASWICPGRLVAITGTNGKTTTTTLTGEILTAAGLDTHVSGNIGLPLADVVLRMKPDSVAVVEVSSFQLETIGDFRPDISLILNLTTDHIDRHGSIEAYRQAKYRVAENQGDGQVLLVNRRDKELAANPPATDARVNCFSTEADSTCIAYVENGSLWMKRGDTAEPVISVEEIAIKGPHNLENSAAATAIAAQFDIAPEVIKRTLISFPGVEHRLERISVVAGVTFINDSKATNVDSVRYALKSVPTPLYLIAGGRDKGGDFASLAQAGGDRIKGIIAIGEARDIIFDALGKKYPVEFSASLAEAVRRCFDLAHPGETVLLSPGCASFDMFDDYEHRGRAFKEAVQELKNGKNSSTQITH